MPTTSQSYTPTIHASRSPHARTLRHDATFGQWPLRDHAVRLEPSGQRVPARDLEPGHLLDLEDDTYADQPGNDLRHSFPYELATVTDTEREMPTCVRVETSAGVYGFPPSHPVPVCGYVNG